MRGRARKSGRAVPKAALARAIFLEESTPSEKRVRASTGALGLRKGLCTLTLFLSTGALGLRTGLEPGPVQLWGLSKG